MDSPSVVDVCLRSYPVRFLVFLGRFLGAVHAGRAAYVASYRIADCGFCFILFGALAWLLWTGTVLLLLWNIKRKELCLFWVYMSSGWGFKVKVPRVKDHRLGGICLVLGGWKIYNYNLIGLWVRVEMPAWVG